MNIIKAFLIEGAIILVLSGISLFALSYFKIIDLTKIISIPQLMTSKQNSSVLVTQCSVPTPKPAFGLAEKMFFKDQKDLQTILESNTASSTPLHFASYFSEFEGKIVSINTAGGVDVDTNRKYKIRIVIGFSKGSQTVTELFSDNDLPKLKVFDSSKKPIAITDLKTNDSIVVRLNASAVYNVPDNLIEAIITKK